MRETLARRCLVPGQFNKEVVADSRSAKRFVESVTGAADSRRLPRAAIVHSKVLPVVERGTMARPVKSGWNKDLWVTLSMASVDVSALDMILQRQMRFGNPREDLSGFNIYVLKQNAGKAMLKRIAALEKEVHGGRLRPLREVRAAIEDHMAVVATRNNSLASFLFVSRRSDIFEDGVALVEVHEPVVSPSQPPALGSELIRYAVDTVHCFSPDTSFVMMMGRLEDPANNSAMAGMGFLYNGPMERPDGTHLLWVYNTAEDLARRVSLAGNKKQTTTERVKEFFTSSPQMSQADVVRSCRVPGYDEGRIRALRAVATMEGSGRAPRAAAQLPKLKPRSPGGKPYLDTLDDVRKVVKAKGYRSLKDLLADYDINPALDDKQKKHWRTVAIIANNTRRNQ